MADQDIGCECDGPEANGQPPALQGFGILIGPLEFSSAGGEQLSVTVRYIGEEEGKGEPLSELELRTLAVLAQRAADRMAFERETLAGIIAASERDQNRGAMVLGLFPHLQGAFRELYRSMGMAVPDAPKPADVVRLVRDDESHDTDAPIPFGAEPAPEAP